MGGDHKCPLCSATFTRPQHVGRHLRAHTGDRPYECKECPLRFARSDLLSRHVNKAHKPPDENNPKPPGKKGRRKSMPANTVKPQPPQPPTATMTSHLPPAMAQPKARRASFDVPPGPSNPQPPTLPAHSMYPHHPLLAGAPTIPTQSRPQQQQHPQLPPTGWSSQSPIVGFNGQTQPNFTYPYDNNLLQSVMGGQIGTNGITGFQPPFTAVPMNLAGSDQAIGTSAMVRNSSSLSGYDFGFKKRACDQCNHSKVRCDFAEPCHRCSNRNLRCSYNKPQKSRSIGSSSTPRMSLPMSASATMSASMSGSSSSPQSHFSSPGSNQQNPSPLNKTMLPPSQLPANAPVPGMGSDPQMMFMNPTANQWAVNQQWNATSTPLVDPAISFVSSSPQNGMYSSPAQIAQHPALPQPGSGTAGTYPIPLPHRNSASSSVSSPRHHLAPTPSLVSHNSHATSPSETDEPAERRTSQSSFVAPGIDYGRKGSGASVIGHDPAYSLQHPFDPPGVNAMINVPSASTFQSDCNPFAWTSPATATIDPRTQFRNSAATDEEEPNVTASRPSTASTFFEGIDDNVVQAVLNQRRRSSAGVWANAFHDMTLQDAAGAPIPDPYTASQVAQNQSMKRPSFPTMSHVSESSESTKVPSLGDVKDLWKLFMSEPMTAQGGVPNPMEFNADYPGAMAITPRPGMTRGLSKSNSMPDLTSPLLANQQFFVNYNNGITPKPMLPQNSYNNAQIPAQTAYNQVPGEAVTMNKWKDQIKHRQESFEFGPNIENKLKSSTPPSNTSPPQVLDANPNPNPNPPLAGGNAMLPPDAMNMAMNGRPMASVLQRSSAALEQTLAPERAPSFGLDPSPVRNSFYTGGPTYSHKVTSALARPGNKRLASQTLVPNDPAKKAAGEDWEAEAGGSVDFFALPQGLSTGVTPIGGPVQQGFFGWNPAQMPTN